MSYYPCSLWSPTQKTNKVDLVDASHMNDAQGEIVAIQSQLQKALDSDGTILSGTVFTSPAYGISQLFWRTDLNTLYVKAASGWIAQGGTLSNVLFQYSASILVPETLDTNLNGSTTTTNYRFFRRNDTSATSVWKTKWTKISGISTITVYGQVWGDSGSETCTLTVDVGGASSSVNTTSITAGNWVSLTIDVSGLSNGTVYDVDVKLHISNAGKRVHLGNLISFGS